MADDLGHEGVAVEIQPPCRYAGADDALDVAQRGYVTIMPLMIAMNVTSVEPTTAIRSQGDGGIMARPGAFNASPLVSTSTRPQAGAQAAASALIVRAPLFTHAMHDLG